MLMVTFEVLSSRKLFKCEGDSPLHITSKSRCTSKVCKLSTFQNKCYLWLLFAFLMLGPELGALSLLCLSPFCFIFLVGVSPFCLGLALDWDPSAYPIHTAKMTGMLHYAQLVL
jgi:hypothetical protein